MQDTSTLEKLQNEAARIVTGLTRSVSLVNLYRECGWVPLHTRRKEQKLAFMYKAVNDDSRIYIRPYSSICKRCNKLFSST